MPSACDLEAILSRACALERKYHWSEAARCYQTALASVKPIFLQETCEIRERLGYALFRSAMQAKDSCEFRRRVRQAALSYRKARNVYTSQTDKENAGRVLRCDGMISYVGYWLASTASRKKKWIDECWKLTKMSLKAFDKERENREFGRTFNQLSLSALLAFFLEWNFQTRKTMIKEAANYGEQAIVVFSEVQDSHELALAQVKTATYLEMYANYFLDLDERDGWMQKVSDYRLKAKEYSEETAVIELLNSGAGAVLPLQAFGSEWDRETIINSEKALKYTRKTGDRFIMGWAFAWLAYGLCFERENLENWAEAIKTNRRGLKYAEKAQRNFSVISFICPQSIAYWPESPQADYYYGWAEFTTDLKKATRLIEKGCKASLEQLRRAEDSGYPEAKCYAHLTFSANLYFRAREEADSQKKRRFLEEALIHENECARIFEEYLPFSFMLRFFTQKNLGNIEGALSTLSENLETKKQLLQKAAMHYENVVALIIQQIDFCRKQAIPNALDSPVAGANYYIYGSLLDELYKCTGEEEYLRKAAEALTNAAELLQRGNLPAFVAECHWRRAQIHETIGEYSKAAEHFGLASDNYSRAGKKIPQFRDFYKDLAFYMEAWNDIELAKDHHQRQEHELARQDFERAADALKSSKQWNHLAPNYSAWAQLEHAEELSRREQIEEAVKIFKHAAGLFEEMIESIRASLRAESEQTNDDVSSILLASEQEKGIITGLVRATQARMGYCLARISIEEARMLDQKGDHYSSFEKYHSAAEILEKTARSLDSREDARECNFFIAVTRAWQKMMLAEANVSPELFGEASQFFEQASRFCSSEKMRLSVLGHSHFCKALEAGTTFADAREAAAHSEAMHQLQTATDYYRRARLESAAQYARATGLLFDSYAYMDRAKRDIEPEKKAQLYKMVEMLLKTSAGSYMKAKRPEKMEQVLKLLEGVKEERELAMSLTEILKGSPVVSTATLSAPMPTHEKPVGLERLEHAVVQTRLNASPDVTVGEEFEIRLDLVNVARNLGSLVRIDDLVPQSFKITEVPTECKQEDGSLNLNGRRLEPLKIETIKISMQATQEGTFNVCPKVIYRDDAGKTHASGSEPVQITVRPPLSFEFKTEATDSVFNYLTEAFIEDYMKRGLFVQEAGWRSLVQVVKGTGTSLRSVYGDSGRRGLVVSELERRGLIETRIFQGRRGRGGAVLKLRVSYEKETLKRYIDDKVAKGR